MKTLRSFLLPALILGAGLLVLTPHPVTAAMQLSEGLALHLPLTTDLKDHSSATLPVEVVGHVRIETNGAYFGGRKDWLEAPHIALDQRPFAIALWIRETTEERTVGLVEQFDLNRPLHHFSLLLRGNRQPYFSFYVMDQASPLGVSRDQEWVHLVFQYTGKEQQIWINGRFICSRSAPAYAGETGVTAIGKIPRWTNVPGKDFVGYMLDFRIYQRTLNPEEIGVLAGIRESKKVVVAESAPAAIPVLSEKAVASRAAMTRVLSADIALPFLQINGRQITINGQAGQIYTLESSDDLDRWSPLTRLTNATGRVIYDDRGQEAIQFFRVRVEGFTQ